MKGIIANMKGIIATIILTIKSMNLIGPHNLTNGSKAINQESNAHGAIRHLVQTKLVENMKSIATTIPIKS